MFYREHGVPHFHAVYGDYEISVEVETGRIHGQFPPRALKLILEWMNLHKAELLEVRLIRFCGHLPKGGYDVPNGQREEKPAPAPAV
jgi:hypothetical protein